MSSSARGFRGLLSSSLLGVTVKKSHHLFMGFKRTMGLTFLDVLGRLGQAGINDPPLRWSVLIIGIWEPGSVDYQLRSKDNFAAIEGCFNQIAFNDAGLDTQAGGDGYLSFVLDFCGAAHKSVYLIPKEVRNPDFCWKHSRRTKPVKLSVG